MIPLKGDKAISPGQRPGCCCSRDLRPERAKAIIIVWTAMLLPLQGAIPNIHRPRALPWAGCLLAFQTVTSQKLYRTPIIEGQQVIPIPRLIIFSRHENKFSRHKNEFSRHKNEFSRHKNEFSRHENFCRVAVLLSLPFYLYSLLFYLYPSKNLLFLYFVHPTG